LAVRIGYAAKRRLEAGIGLMVYPSSTPAGIIQRKRSRAWCMRTQNARQNEEILLALRRPAIHRDIGVAIYPPDDPSDRDFFVPAITSAQDTLMALMQIFATMLTEAFYVESQVFHVISSVCPAVRWDLLLPRARDHRELLE